MGRGVLGQDQACTAEKSKAAVKLIEGVMKGDKQGKCGLWLGRDLTSPPRGHSSFHLTRAASPHPESCCCLAETVSGKALMGKHSWITKLSPVLLCRAEMGESGLGPLSPVLRFPHPWCFP